MSGEEFAAKSLSLFTLAKLLEGCEAECFGRGETRVHHITEDSRRVTAGSLFVARKGQAADGRQYVDDALAKGAAAVLCESDAGISIEPRIEVKKIAKAWGLCAQALYDNPSRSLRVMGITGTNGKTTVASLVQQALNHLGQKVGRLGTLGFFVDEEKLDDSLTTPQPDKLAQHLAKARSLGAESFVLEVSSHALIQERIRGLHLQVAAFTNLSQDHLDYHGTMAAYGAAKARLFRDCQPEKAVINIDDSMGRKLAEEFEGAVTISASGDPKAFISAADTTFGRAGMAANVRVDKENYGLSSTLLGRYNLENLLVAWGMLHCSGVPPIDAAAALGKATGVPGRMERCDGPEDDLVVVVDYAHTPDALERALLALVELSYVELICVFGCGGDRDTKKRAPMGEVAAKHSDLAYLTSDNPRTEDPAAITEQVKVGFGSKDNWELVLSRRLAIEKAIGCAKPGAVVLIAGKGHEPYQIVGEQYLVFDDREEARRALALRRQGSLP